MKIAVIVKTDLKDSKVYTTHRSKISYHTDNLFLSETDKNAIEYALGLIHDNGGMLDAYTFEQGVLADRVLHEAMAMGADTATKFTGVDSYDPLQVNTIADQFVNYLKKRDNYDLILTGSNNETGSISAFVANKLGYAYVDHVMKIDNSFNYETALEKGHLNGQFKLPAVVSVLEDINTPHLPSFINLRDALNSKIDEVSLNTDDVTDSSKLIADQNKQKHLIFDMHEDPDAVQKLVNALKADGILKWGI